MEQRQSQAKMSDEYVKLLAHVVDQPDGAILNYEEVQSATGINMDTQTNRSKLRQAILRSGKEYSVIPTVGYQLADSSTAMGILTHKLLRIDTSVRRANRAQTVVQQQFFDELDEDERKGVLFLGAVFGAIRTAAENGKKLYGKERPALTQADATIPTPD